MRGRPKLKQEDKRQFFGVTISPNAAAKFDKVKGNRSLFIDMILTKIPDSWIKQFNQSPEKFTLEPFGK